MPEHYPAAGSSPSGLSCIPIGSSPPIDAALRRKRTVAAERAGYLIAFFDDKPWPDCGEDDPLVLEFDHLGDKAFNISQGVRNRSWTSVLEEMKKCDVVCANCHRRRTARRAGFARATAARG